MTGAWGDDSLDWDRDDLEGGKPAMTGIARFTYSFNSRVNEPREDGDYVLYTDHIAALEAVKATGPSPVSNLVGAARAFMDIFVIDNGDDRGLSIEDIDMVELTNRFAALEAALSAPDEGE